MPARRNCIVCCDPNALVLRAHGVGLFVWHVHGAPWRRVVRAAVVTTVLCISTERSLQRGSGDGTSLPEIYANALLRHRSVSSVP